MTLEELRDRKKKRDKSRAALAEEIQGLKIKADNLEKAAKAATAAGDLDLFMKKKREARETADLIEFKQEQLDAASGYDSEEVTKQVWLDYEKKPAAQLRKDYEAFLKARNALADQFANMVERYSQLVSVRRECAELAGVFNTTSWPLEQAPWLPAELRYWSANSAVMKENYDKYLAEAAKIGI